jgi:ADP-ribosylglycohydrolase
VAGGDFEQSIFGAANYGRDNDSIAGMAGSIAGALHGTKAIRPNWMQQIDTANRVELKKYAEGLTALVVNLQRQQLAAAQARDAAFASLLSS